MSLLIVLIIAMAAGLTGIAIGWFLRFIISLGKKGSMELEIKEMLLGAKEEVDIITSEAEQQAQEIIKEAKKEAKDVEEKADRIESRIIAKEDAIEARQKEIDKDEHTVREEIQKIDIAKKDIDSLRDSYTKKLSEIAHIPTSEIKNELIDNIEKEHEEDLLVRLQKISEQNEDTYETKARDILASVIQRMSKQLDHTLFTHTVNLPSEDMKGKIIGKEGRNIKTFENLTGVEVIIDDTPGVVTLSSFDPVRREIATVALGKLIKDGRIQPVKIEKTIEQTKDEIQKIIKKKGEEAAYEAGVFNLDARLIQIVGRLHFRTSYGQNVLSHSVEMAHIAGMLAEELGANVKIAKAGALLHDIGKAMDHEVPGTHVEIGRRILQKFEVSEDIIKAMQAHHEEYPYETIESIIVQVADSISGGRPGARRDNAENYLKRLSELEAIATHFDGVEKAYALEAGREIRVFVKPENVSDYEAAQLARDIARKIEKDLKYPGEIKVNVIRENRVIEYAR